MDLDVQHYLVSSFYIVGILSFIVFTALNGMQTRYSDENFVCLSLCLSVRLSYA